jgi:hypothetical protein
VHWLPTPPNVPFCARQAAWVVWEQTLTASPWTQQAPVCGAQTLAVLQDVPLPRNVPWWEAQSASVICEQVTPMGVVKQHAPVGGGVPQVVVEQTLPSPW